MIHQDQIHFRFFIKNCLWAGMGSTRYLNLIPKIQNLFGGRLLVFCCDGRFLLNHSRSICGFFRSIDPGNTGSSGSFDSFGILCSSLAFGIQEIILLWKSDFGIQRQVPSCQIWPGSSITMMVLLSFLSSLRLFLLSLTGCLEFLDLGFVFLGVSIIYHTKTPVYIDKVDILMMHYLYNCCIEVYGGAGAIGRRFCFARRGGERRQSYNVFIYKGQE